MENDRCDTHARIAPSNCLVALATLCFAAFMGSSCKPGDSGPPPGANDNANGNDNAPPAGEVPGLVYLLQPDGVPLTELIETRFQWLVLEPSRTGSPNDDFSRDQIDDLRTQGPCGGKIVLAYLSVGEAEDYRGYWEPAWVDPNGTPVPGVAPAWLGPSNPDWPGNYKVRYWDPEWQAIILGTSEGPDKTPLDRIIDAGFSGVYLDIIDGFDFWSSESGGDELSRAEARRRMIEWVRTIAQYARVTRGATSFRVFPQNAEDIVRNDDYELDELSDDYFDAISGIGVEALFYDETRPQAAEGVAYRLEQLVEFRARDKTVLVTDYVVGGDLSPAGSDARVADFYERTLDQGFIPYAALEDRALNEIVILPPQEWSVSQPPGQCVNDD